MTTIAGKTGVLSAVDERAREEEEDDDDGWIDGRTSQFPPVSVLFGGIGAVDLVSKPSGPGRSPRIQAPDDEDVRGATLEDDLEYSRIKSLRRTDFPF